MAATKAELFLSALQISDPLAGFPPPHPPLDCYARLEELQILLQSSILSASADNTEGPGDYELLGGGETWVSVVVDRAHGFDMNMHHRVEIQFRKF